MIVLFVKLVFVLNYSSILMYVPIQVISSTVLIIIILYVCLCAVNKPAILLCRRAIDIVYNANAGPDSDKGTQRRRKENHRTSTKNRAFLFRTAFCE